MDVTVASNAAYEERVLDQICKLAKRCASKQDDRQTTADLAQEVVLECLLKMRDGTWREPRSLGAFVRRLVATQRLDNARRKEREGRRHRAYARSLERAAPEWMSPDLCAEANELAAFAKWSVIALPPMCQRVYVMVRQEHASYDVVAERLGITRSTVSASMVRAQRQIRQYLRERGMGTERSVGKLRSRGRPAARRSRRRVPAAAPSG